METLMLLKSEWPSVCLAIQPPFQETLCKKIKGKAVEELVYFEKHYRQRELPAYRAGV